MRTRSKSALPIDAARTLTPTLAVAWLLAAGAASAQTLPPPPPPPVGQETAPPPSPPPMYVRYRRRREVAAVYEEHDPPRPFAITWNPAALVLGRLSANLEVLVAPHSSLVVSPNVLVFQADRGGRWNSESQGLGFASRTSSSFGLELGYHFWPRWSRDLRGPFFGPSVLAGSTTNATAGNAGSAQTYVGFAFDAGVQAVVPGGFTFGGGVGLGFVHLADANALFPRLLLQLGWSF